MTPQEWTTFVKGWIRRQEHQDRQIITHAWLVANFSNRKELPSLKSLLEPPVEVVELPPEEVERQAALMNAVTNKLDALKERKKARAARGK